MGCASTKSATAVASASMDLVDDTSAVPTNTSMEVGAVFAHVASPSTVDHSTADNPVSNIQGLVDDEYGSSFSNLGSVEVVIHPTGSVAGDGGVFEPSPVDEPLDGDIPVHGTMEPFGDLSPGLHGDPGTILHRQDSSTDVEPIVCTGQPLVIETSCSLSSVGVPRFATAMEDVKDVGQSHEVPLVGIGQVLSTHTDVGLDVLSLVAFLFMALYGVYRLMFFDGSPSWFALTVLVSTYFVVGVFVIVLCRCTGRQLPDDPMVANIIFITHFMSAAYAIVAQETPSDSVSVASQPHTERGQVLEPVVGSVQSPPPEAAPDPPGVGTAVGVDTTDYVSGAAAAQNTPSDSVSVVSQPHAERESVLEPVVSSVPSSLPEAEPDPAGVDTSIGIKVGGKRRGSAGGSAINLCLLIMAMIIQVVRMDAAHDVREIIWSRILPRFGSSAPIDSLHSHYSFIIDSIDQSLDSRCMCLRDDGLRRTILTAKFSVGEVTTLMEGVCSSLMRQHGWFDKAIAAHKSGYSCDGSSKPIPTLGGVVDRLATTASNGVLSMAADIVEYTEEGVKNIRSAVRESRKVWSSVELVRDQTNAAFDRLYDMYEAVHDGAPDVVDTTKSIIDTYKTLIDAIASEVERIQSLPNTVDAVINVTAAGVEEVVKQTVQAGGMLWSDTLRTGGVIRNKTLPTAERVSEGVNRLGVSSWTAGLAAYKVGKTELSRLYVWSIAGGHWRVFKYLLHDIGHMVEYVADGVIYRLPLGEATEAVATVRTDIIKSLKYILKAGVGFSSMVFEVGLNETILKLCLWILMCVCLHMLIGLIKFMVEIWNGRNPNPIQ